MRDLIERAKVGDHEAFSELAGLWIDRLYAIARLILRDDDSAQDATQEALVVAWRDIGGLRDVDQFDRWMRRVLVRACYREARSARTRHRIESHVRALENEPDEPGRSLEARDQLDHAFRRLASDDRALIVLHFYVGLPMAETADALGIPVGTVKSRLHRTTRAMRATLDSDARGAAIAVPRT